MADRCLNCNGILTRTDKVCYSCGDRVPKWVSKASIVALDEPKPHSLLSTLMLLASIGLTAYSFLAPEKPSLPVSLATSGALLAGKFILDWSARARARARAKQG